MQRKNVKIIGKEDERKDKRTDSIKEKIEGKRKLGKKSAVKNWGRGEGELKNKERVQLPI